MYERALASMLAEQSVIGVEVGEMAAGIVAGDNMPSALRASI
jgi:hypothetical protein